ncbi:MAG: hypothetical protein ACREDX_02780 [Aestuariivirga sp.]
MGLWSMDTATSRSRINPWIVVWLCFETHFLPYVAFCGSDP